MKVPVEVLVHQKARTLELVYEDGARAVLPFEFLRVLSPSAEVIFDDGHDSGLYSWDYLETLGERKDALWSAYLDELAEAGASRDPKDPANAPFLAKMHPKKSCGH